MKKLWICNKWEMMVEGNTLEEAIEINHERKIKHEKRIQHLSDNAYCLYKALKIIGKVKNVLDICAGIGLWATILQKECNPELTLVELDRACCKQLRKNFPKATIDNKDYNNIFNFNNYDLICMDITISTVMRTLGEDASIPLFRILEGNSKWVFISDCAAGKLHLNAIHYKKVLGKFQKNYLQYLHLYSEILKRKTGKRIHSVFMSGKTESPHSCYMLIGENKKESFNVVKVKNIPASFFGYKKPTLF